MVVHFQAVADAVLASAPAGMLGAVAFGAFMVALASRLRDAGEALAAALVVTGGALAAGYLLFVHVAYVSLAYAVTGTSPEVAKGLFVTTILATAVYGVGATLALGGAAYGAAQAGLLPRWWYRVSAVGAALAAVALVSYADSGFFSPDVQQQVVAGVLQLWLLLTAVALVRKMPFSAGVGRRSHARSSGPLPRVLHTVSDIPPGRADPASRVLRTRPLAR